MVSFLGHPVCYVNSNSDDLIYGQISSTFIQIFIVNRQIYILKLISDIACI